MTKGNLIILSGPSGSGKDAVLKELFKKTKDVNFSISTVTRQMRKGEKQGEKYNFVSREEFERMINNNELLEYNEYCGNFYGTPKKQVVESINNGKDIVLEIDVNGAKNVRDSVNGTVSIFIVPPSFEELKNRLEGRGTESEEVINARMKTAIDELSRANEYDYVVVNDSLEEAANDIIAILKSEKLKYKKQQIFLNEVFSKC